MQIIREKNFAAVLFFVAADEYCTISSEDPTRTKMVISRKIFAEICNNDFIGEATPVILFLNRKDLFHNRIVNDTHWEIFRKAFPEYNGRRQDDEALEFLGQTFLKVLDSNQKKRIVNIHYTCALDTKAMSVVWSTVREAVLRELLTKVGYM